MASGGRFYLRYFGGLSVLVLALVSVLFWLGSKENVQRDAVRKRIIASLVGVDLNLDQVGRSNFEKRFGAGTENYHGGHISAVGLSQDYGWFCGYADHGPNVAVGCIIDVTFVERSDRPFNVIFSKEFDGSVWGVRLHDPDARAHLSKVLGNASHWEVSGQPGGDWSFRDKRYSVY